MTNEKKIFCYNNNILALSSIFFFICTYINDHLFLTHTIKMTVANTLNENHMPTNEFYLMYIFSPEGVKTTLVMMTLCFIGIRRDEICVYSNFLRDNQLSPSLNHKI